jgi:hypothetical protein
VHMEHELSPREKTPHTAPRDRASIEITLVPGTWAFGFFRHRADLYHPANPPRWFEEGSEFRTTLEAELRRMEFDFSIKVLQWDCANSVRSRAMQAESLAKSLTSQRSPGIRRVIIGHSHGGSIAFKAASLVETSDDDLAIVTLSTPFLQASSRREDSPKALLSLLFILIAALGWGAIFVTTGQTKLILGLEEAGALGFVVAAIWYRWKEDLEIANTINAPVNPAARVLVIRGFSDEASSSLVVGSIGMGLMNAMFYVLAFPMRWVAGAKWRVALMIACYIGSIVLLAKTASIIFKVISIWAVIASLAALAAVPVAIGGVFALLYGRELFFESLNLVFTVDSVPDCECNADVITLSATQTSISGLRHGIYSHAGCPLLIARWLVTGRAWHYLNGVPYSTHAQSSERAPISL